MIDDNFYNLWNRFVESGELSSPEQTLLASRISESESLVKEFVDDCVIHRLVGLVAEHDVQQEHFVAGCLERFESKAIEDREPDPVKIELKKTAVKRQPIEINRKRRSRAKWGVGLLGLATVLAIGCFVVVMQDFNRTGVSQKQNRETTAAASEPGGTGVDADHSLRERELPALDKIDLAHDENNVAPTHRPPMEKSLVSTQEESEQVGHVNADQSDPTTNSVGIATVRAEPNAEWASELTESRIGPRSLFLNSGTALVELDNGIRVFLNGPAKVELISPEEFVVHSGRVMVESPANNLGDFELSTRDGIFNQMVDAKVHVFVDAKGTELALSRGRIELTRQKHVLETEPISFDVAGLRHVYINSTSDLKTIPSIVIAHGGGKYLGQIGVGGDTIQSSSPDEFEQLLRRQPNIDSSLQKESNLGLRMQIRQFNKMFRQLENQFGDSGSLEPSNNLGPRGFSFQGEITIEGQNVDFTTTGNFKNFTELLKKRFGSPEKAKK